MTFIIRATDRCTVDVDRRSAAVVCVGETMELRGGILGAPDTIYLDGEVAFVKREHDGPGIADGHWECRAPWVERGFERSPWTDRAAYFATFRYTHLEFGWTPTPGPTAGVDSAT